MKPIRVQASNYRSFRELDLNLPHGTCAVVGSNGAGKSSVINVIDLCLFGPESRSLEHYLSDDGADEMVLALEFEHGGDFYRVRRGYRARGRGSSSLDFEHELIRRADDSGVDTWEPLTRETTAATQAVIEQTIGLSRATFRASAFLAQSDGAAFTEAQPKDRKAILAEILALHVWEQLLERAHTDRRAVEAERERLAGETATLEVTIAGKPRVDELLAACDDVARNATTDLMAREQALEQAQAALRDAEQAASKRQAAEAELARARAEHDRLNAIKTSADQALADHAIAQDELATLTTAGQLDALVQAERAAESRLALLQQERATHDAAVRDHDLKRSQRDAIAAQAADHRAKALTLREQAARLEETGPGHATCDRCEQTLGVEALVSMLANMRVEADEFDATAKDLDAQATAIEVPTVPAAPSGDSEALDAELARIRGHLIVAREHQATRARLEERIRSFERTIALADEAGFATAFLNAAVAYQDAYEAVMNLGAPADISGRTAAVEAARREVDQERARLQTALTEKARAETLLAQIHDAEEKLAAAGKRTAELHEEIDLLADLEKAYGRDGIPALLVESQAVPHIEAEANRLLSALGTSYRVELHTQRALKSGDGLRDTLDIVVVADGGARPYETFSGGERTRINLALRIALARLLANRRGAESRLLCIDEPEFLDEDGVMRLAEVLHGLTADFDSVLLVSHVPSLRDSFDTTLEVTKDDAGSRVAVAA